jgi:hypothetical protein
MDNFNDDYRDSVGTERALYAVAIALSNVAYQLKYLGNGDAATQMGAIEALGKHLGESLDRIAETLDR